MESEELLYLGDALRYFVNHIKINVYQGNTVINLIDYLPLLKLGYVRDDDLYSLMYSYAQFDKDCYEQLWEKAFADEISAEFYNVTDPENKLSIDYAVKQMYIEKPLNTFELLKEWSEDNTIKLSDLIEHNSYKIEDDLLLSEYSDDPNFLQEMESESKILYNIIKIIDIHRRWPDRKIDLQSLINMINFNELFRVLLNDERLKLYIAIIEKDINKVKDYLLTIDPRFDDNQAYVLAVEMGDPQIIKIIKDDIIQREWLEKQIFLKYIGHQGFDIRKTYGKK